MTELENLNNYVKALEEKLLQHEKWDTEEHQAIRVGVGHANGSAIDGGFSIVDTGTELKAIGTLNGKNIELEKTIYKDLSSHIAIQLNANFQASHNWNQYGRVNEITGYGVAVGDFPITNGGANPSTLFMSDIDCWGSAHFAVGQLFSMQVDGGGSIMGMTLQATDPRTCKLQGGNSGSTTITITNGSILYFNLLFVSSKIGEDE